MKLAIITPVLTRLPKSHATWEDTAEIEDVARLAVEAERLGYDHLTCSEHVAIPTEIVKVRGGTYWDPLSVFGYLAAVTRKINFATFVLVLGYHHPLEIVKRYGTLDRVCGSRLILGVGVGSLQEEFDLLGVPFAGRGELGDDALRAIRAAYGVAEPSYSGTHYDFSGFVIDPVAPRTDVPIWIGGRTGISLRRAVKLGDGWAPFGLSLEQMGEMLRQARESQDWNSRRVPLEVALQSSPLDPIANPEKTREEIAALSAAGMTTLEARFVHHSLDHYLEQLAALRELVPTS
jgi:probable F420-dependent oxidoreductase